MKLISKLQKLFESQGFKVERGNLDDKSADWLIYRKKDSKIFIEFLFEDEGKTLSDIKIWKDIVAVLDQKQLM